MVLGTTSSEVPVSTMAWQPWVQATASPPRETLGRKVRGEAKRRLGGGEGSHRARGLRWVYLSMVICQ